ncbi:uncharacterized protein TNIN_236231 [Trichonephila inaurata madagascariensis]|uniref:Uncharacterized protein n=1 Tax=Trichonephila inaurata madagascariensis TaxID=2747483 RepID=A0A8X7CSS1_9ARAC|nr:uncharacterized protein TNIN_236231 [Trichonephila inaurata madagascariensis]
MENHSDDHSVIMEEIDPPTLTDEQKCTNLQSIDKQIRIFTARKDYITEMLNIEKSIPGPTTETTQKMEAEAASLDVEIKALEAKLTAKIIKNNKLDDKEFKVSRETLKSSSVLKDDPKITATNNKFAAFDTANNDFEDVTLAAPKIKPIMMKLFPESNLILQELHRIHPTATNTHVGGYIKIQAENADHHRKITNFLTSKKAQYYVTDPLANRPLKLVIKGLLASTDPKEIKNDPIS